MDEDEDFDTDEETAGEQQKKERGWAIRPWQYKKGQSGNPSGRPIGAKSMKTYVKEKLERMTDEEREEFLEGVDKRILWEMSEGKAKQDVDLKGEITSKVISVDE